MTGEPPRPNTLELAAQTRMYLEDMMAVCDHLRTVIPECHDPRDLHLLCSTLITAGGQRIGAARDLSILERVLGEDYSRLIAPPAAAAESAEGEQP